MKERQNIRFGLLKFMYIYTIIGAGGFGLGILIVPATMKSVFGWPDGDPIALGVTGSVYTAFAISSVFGLLSPLKFAPILLLQLCYKSVWFIGVILPLVFRSSVPTYAFLYMIIFATYIAGDIIAIPFSTLLGNKQGS